MKLNKITKAICITLCVTACQSTTSDDYPPKMIVNTDYLKPVAEEKHLKPIAEKRYLKNKFNEKEILLQPIDTMIKSPEETKKAPSLNKNYSTIKRGSYKEDYYNVQNGDTLYFISHITGQNIKKIARLNNLTLPYTIYPHQRLVIRNSNNSSNTVKQLSFIKPKQTESTRNEKKTVPPLNIAKQKNISISNIDKKTVTNIKQSNFIVERGERYITAIEKWLTRSKIEPVAYSLPRDVAEALNKVSENGDVFQGSLKEVVQQLSNIINKPLYFNINEQNIGAVHTFNGNVDILLIRGKTVKEAIKNLTHDYKWKWSEKNSWLSPDDFPLLASYPIVVPKGEFAAALNIVIDGYPLIAQQLIATKSIFIVEKE